MKVPKAFRLDDYKARALHDYAVKKDISDSKLLESIVSDWLNSQDGYDPFKYIAEVSHSSRK